MARPKVPAQPQSLTDAYVIMAAEMQAAYMQEADLSIDHLSTSFARAMALVADGGNQPRTPFDEALKDFFELENKSQLERSRLLRQFFREVYHWSDKESNQYLASRADHWPPIKRQPLSICDLSRWDFGGFLSMELPGLKSDYARWKEARNSQARQQNFAKQKATVLTAEFSPKPPKVFPKPPKVFPKPPKNSTSG